MTATDGDVGDQCIDWQCRAGCAARKMLAASRPFIAFIRRQADADFHVSFPDFPGCI